MTDGRPLAGTIRLERIAQRRADRGTFQPSCGEGEQVSIASSAHKFQDARCSACSKTSRVTGYIEEARAAARPAFNAVHQKPAER